MTLPFFSVRVNQPFLIWSRKRPCFHFARHPRVAHSLMWFEPTQTHGFALHHREGHGMMFAKHSYALHGQVQLDAAWTQT